VSPVWAHCTRCRRAPKTARQSSQRPCTRVRKDRLLHATAPRRQNGPHGPAARHEGSLRLLHDCGQPRSNRREPSKQPTLGHENEHDAPSDTESCVAAGSGGSGYQGQCGRRARIWVGDVGCAICDSVRSNGTKVGSSRSADLQVICPGLVWSWDGIDGATIP
jgi:hypothetical protein